MEDQVNYKRLYVQRQKGGDLYPRSIPKERGPTTTYICIALCVSLFLVDIATDQKNPVSVIFSQHISALSLLVFLQIIYRLILMCEEYQHLVSRYKSSLRLLISDVFHFQNWKYILTVLFSCIIYCTVFGINLGELYIFKLILLTSNIFLLGKLLQLSAGHLNNALWVAENNGLDYGSGMAYSFFYGYLNLVLPKTGGEDKNLKEIMQDYEDKNNITFATYKLFILIPKSMTCPVTLKNEYSPFIEESSSLEEKKLTVAGVQNRSYKNSVYKIRSETGNKKYYVSAEYATPLKTFKDVFNNRGIHSEFYSKLKKDIILQFYLTLQKILEEKGLDQFCEPIYFEDSYLDQTGKRRFYDVGKLILTRIRELKKQK